MALVRKCLKEVSRRKTEANTVPRLCLDNREGLLRSLGTPRKEKGLV